MPAPVGQLRIGTIASLVLGSAALTLVAAVLIFAQARNALSEDASSMRWRDSVAGVVFGFERQFARVRGELAAAAVAPPGKLDSAALQLRYDILVSRVDLLKGGNSVLLLRDSTEYLSLAPRLEAFLREADRTLASGSLKPADAAALVSQMDAMAPDVQSLTAKATAVTARLVEAQFDALRRQALWIGGLAALQLVLLGFSVHLVWSRQKQDAAARAKLERLATELGQAKLAAETANQTKSRFLANMSHEMRTPFQGVLGMLQLLDQSQPTPAQRELISTARDSATHLLTLLNDVLDLSAIESGRITLIEAPINLHRLCRDVHRQMRKLAEDAGLTLEVRTSADLPQWVVGDATRLKQILFNLLSNAIKFTPSGAVTLEARQAGSAAGLADLVFTVTDTGIGMDDETLSRLFKRFEMGDPSVSRRIGGAGLGLEISRSLARLMGGDLTVRSKLGEGSRFKLSLCLALCDSPISVDAGDTRGAGDPATPLNVLIADDHPINRKYLSLVLESLGHQVCVCSNGMEALDLARRTRFDLVLMDVHMPVMDGLAAARAIRALGGHWATLPIFAITADVMSNAAATAGQSGITAFLGKPLQIEQLNEAIGQAIGQSRDTATAPPARHTGPAPLSSRFGDLSERLPPGELPELVRMFFSDDSLTIADLEAALANNDARKIADAAHKLKGSARMLGFLRIASVAEEIEKNLQPGHIGRSAAQMQASLQAALDATRRALVTGLEADA